MKIIGIPFPPLNMDTFKKSDIDKFDELLVNNKYAQAFSNGYFAGLICGKSINTGINNKQFLEMCKATKEYRG